MKQLLILSTVCVGLSAALANAADRATPDDAKAMAVKAADFLKANGLDKACPAFQDKAGQFRDRELYVTVQDNKGVMVCHATNAALMGKSMLDLVDVDGKPFNREIQAIKDSGWIEYKWKNPVSNAVEEKVAYEVRVGDYIVGVGAYKK
jgi:cytochrome c